MRARLIFIVVIAVLAFGFAGLNWSEVTRAVPLSFGVLITDGSVGLVLLALLALTLVTFLIASTLQETRHHIDYGKHQRTLQAQRDLAEKAETSRFVELQRQMEAHLRDSRQRESIASTEFEKSMMTSHRELRSQIESMNQMLTTRLRDMESRIDRVHGTEPVREVTDVRPREADLPPRGHAKL